jgi:hypothetical protein
MRIAILNPPFRLPSDPTRWITVPPQGYGGIQWAVANLIDGLLSHGCEMYLLGAPGTPSAPNFEVVPATERGEVESWLRQQQVDVVHDHSNGQLTPSHIGMPTLVGTFHLTGIPKCTTNCIYLSHTQRLLAGSSHSPVIRLPVNPERYLFGDGKQDYLLFLGRVSRHKGVVEAAAFAESAGLPLKVAGPTWERDYYEELISRFPRTVQYVGEVGGRQRLLLIAQARAVLAMSQAVPGPFGTIWSEPGATVVSEAAISGTPVVATPNGCLAELVPGVGCVVNDQDLREQTATQARRVLDSLPTADQVRAAAIARWGHKQIANEYITAYETAIAGPAWT